MEDVQVIKSVVIGVAALVVLMVSSEKAVKNILALADHYGYSATFVGLTVFSLTTSLPEIIAHFTASMHILAGTMNYKIVSGTVLGANIGSDVIQQTFLLGMVVLLTGGMTFKKEFLLTAYLPMIGTTLMCIVLGWDGEYSRMDGIILLSAFVAYMLFLYKREVSVHEAVQAITDQTVYRPGRDAAIALLCLAAMMASAHFLLLSVEKVVAATGLGASLIGVVSIGVASASPELFTAFSGIRQKAVGVSLGTLIGSNIANPLVAIGGGALISTYWVPRPLVYWDLMMETVTAALLLIYLLLKKERGVLGRAGAFYLMGLYFFYLYIRVMYFSVD